MDPVTNRAVVFVMAFVILSVAQRLAGAGWQPRLACQLRNTFQLETSTKRLEDDGASVAGGPTLRPVLGLGALKTVLQKVCQKGDDTSSSTSSANRFHVAPSTPLNPWYASRRSPSYESLASESSESPGAGHRTSFDAYDDE